MKKILFIFLLLVAKLGYSQCALVLPYPQYPYDSLCYNTVGEEGNYAIFNTEDSALYYASNGSLIIYYAGCGALPVPQYPYDSNCNWTVGSYDQYAQYYVLKQLDSVLLADSGGVVADTGISGIGDSNYIPVFSDPKTLTISKLFQKQSSTRTYWYTPSNWFIQNKNLDTCSLQFNGTAVTLQSYNHTLGTKNYLILDKTSNSIALHASYGGLYLQSNGYTMNYNANYIRWYSSTNVEVKSDSMNTGGNTLNTIMFGSAHNYLNSYKATTHNLDLLRNGTTVLWNASPDTIEAPIKSAAYAPKHLGELFGYQNTGDTSLCYYNSGTGHTDTISLTSVNWTSNPQGFSSFTTNRSNYNQQGNEVFVSVQIQGTSNATSFSFSLPFNAATTQVVYYGDGEDNSANTNFFANLTAGSTTVTLGKTVTNNATGWTASNVKGAWIQFRYTKQ